MAVMQTYELQGKKLSFANWISNLSPTETPFITMTQKEAVDHTKFSWQTDTLNDIVTHAHVEGSDALDAEAVMNPTTVLNGYTQILRRVVKVSDTANMLASYGRGREVPYQLEKAGLAIKRDLEAILLSDQVGDAGSPTTPRKAGSFQGLVAPLNAVMPGTGAVIHFESAASGVIDFADIRKMTYNIYLANSKANIIMFHPKHAITFSALQETNGQTKLFDGDEKTFSYYVNTYIDEFGKEYKLVPNRFMPEDALYFFNSKDFTQMVLRAPQRIKLAKEGSFEQWMIEMEVGLRLDNPFSAGVIKAKA
ncbi:major head protein [Trabzonvirus APT65]|uniref:Major head protein n=1 Tax=Aeromonas phage APT65 TaxID=2982914 RepID=A0A9E8GAM1_9CAUD|nr:major head protein [Aeromonas phage APT65]